MKLSSVYSRLDDGIAITMPTFRDVSSEAYPIIQQIKTACANGDTTLANKLMADNAAVLSGMSVTSAQIYQLFEEIRNAEILTLSRKKDIFYSEQGEVPDALSVGDVFICPIKKI